MLIITFSLPHSPDCNDQRKKPFENILGKEEIVGSQDFFLSQNGSMTSKTRTLPWPYINPFPNDIF